jgi:putative addiction module CopG family antidote
MKSIRPEVLKQSSGSKTIELSEDLQAFAEERVRAGEYGSVGEVAAEAFRLLKMRAERREQVRKDLGRVFQEIDDGNHVEPTDEEFARAVHERALDHMSE